MLPHSKGVAIMRFHKSSSTWALLGCILGSQKYKILALLMSVSIYDESKIGFNSYLPVDFLTNRPILYAL